MTAFALSRSLSLPSPTKSEPKKPRLRSEDLFRMGSELIIEHRGEEYRLKLTRNDKLILNK